MVPHSELRIQVCYHPHFSPRRVSIREDRELGRGSENVGSSSVSPTGCISKERQESERNGGGGSRQESGKTCSQMTPQERRQYDWYIKKYERADMTGNPKAERERISMIIAALFPYHSHMPPERHERKVGKKKSLPGETLGESRDEIKARTAAQKQEQQVQRAKAQQRALMHAAPYNVHHVSTRQKAQSKSEAAAEKKSRSPSPSHSSSSGSSSSSSSSPSKGEQDEQEVQEVPTEQVTAPEPPPEEPKVVKPSPLFRLAKRLSRKTTVFPTEQPPKEVQEVEETPVQPSMEAQEAREMPPPDPPRPWEPELPIPSRSGEPESGTSNYESAEEPEEEVTSSGRRKRPWGSITPSAASENEMGQESLDLQSHDPRPESVAMAGWAQGLSVPTACNS